MAIIKNVFLNNCKIANELINLNIKEDYETQISPFNFKKKFIKTSFSFIFISNSIFKDETTITAFDLSILDSIYTLMMNGYEEFNPKLICSILNGKPLKTINPEWIKKILESLEKLQNIHLSIDVTGEFWERNLIAKDESKTFNGRLLPIESLNDKKDTFHLQNKPILYEYAEQINQIIALPYSLFKNKSKLTASEETNLIKWFLAKRIAVIKNPKNKFKNQKISYERINNYSEVAGMFCLLDYQKHDFKKWRDKKNKIHKKVTAILESFRIDNFIQDYEISYHATQIDGVKIFVDNKTAENGKVS